MSQKLQAAVARSTGMVYAEVPPACMWNLVTFLSEQRVAVSYHYAGSHFTVRFPQSDLAGAQRLLDTWARADVGELVGAA